MKIGKHDGSSAPLALSLTGVTRKFGRKQALAGIDLAVPTGAIFGLVGPNGAGKTTTFGIACGFLSPDSGTVDLLGQGPFNPERHRGRVTALPQDAALGRDMLLQEQLEFFARLQGLSRDEARRDVARILQVVDLEDRAKERTRTLSHGMLRRLGIGQAFLGSPELVLLDEPTNGLDPRHAVAIREFIASQRGKRTVIVSSHNLHEIETLCDHVALIDQGRVIVTGSVAEVTGRDGEVSIQLGMGPTPVSELQAEFPGEQVIWQDSSRTLLIRFTRRPDREAEDIIGLALRTLLQHGARISEVSRGQSLERTYLDAT